MDLSTFHGFVEVRLTLTELEYGLRHSQPSFMPSPRHYRLFFFLHLKALVDIFHTDVYSVSAVKQCIPVILVH